MTAGAGGGSSTMPHKANPVAAEALVTLARLNAGTVGELHQAMLHAEERDGSALGLEWFALPAMCAAAGAATRHALALAETLEAHPERIAATLAADRGLMLAEAAVFALAERMPRPEAQALVGEAVKARGGGGHARRGAGGTGAGGGLGAGARPGTADRRRGGAGRSAARGDRERAGLSAPGSVDAGRTCTSCRCLRRQLYSRDAHRPGRLCGYRRRACNEAPDEAAASAGASPIVGMRVRTGVKAKPRVPRGGFASLDPVPTRGRGACAAAGAVACRRAPLPVMLRRRGRSRSRS